ncbi:MAG TPA: helix-turn-helix domain-containing protein [Jatrophihabitans sp.]|jgi:DNA-binding IclR family transcriptional regulator|nr:helix-turn-helix domain-containing protein [Jatrophihabitans sp.]
MSSSRRSPPTQRVVDLLDHVLAHPSERFGLSELSRAVGISKPTCLGIVSTLADTGWLICDAESRAYGVGPALVAAGRLARRAVPGVEAAEQHLVQLATRYGAACSASAVVGEEIVVLVSVRADGRPTGPQAGARYPFAPPLGLMYVLWDTDRAFDRWLTTRPALPMTLDREHLRQVVAECRERGYLVEGLTEVGRRLHTLMAGVAAYDLPDEVRDLVGEMVSTLGERVYVGAELTARGKHPTHLLAAPTYDSNGRQELVVTLAVDDSITGADISRRGKALMATAAAITAEAGGVPPCRKANIT